MLKTMTKFDTTEEFDAYRSSVEDTCAQLKGSAHGLASTAAEERIATVGKNELPEDPQETLFSIFVRQFKSPLLYILVVAGIVAFILGEFIDGSVILGVLVLNGIIGTFQEGKAQASLAALKKYTDTESLVLRNGKADLVSSTLLVPGDVIILREGDKIPADARIIESQNLTCNEAALTGESLPVNKITGILEGSVEIADQKNMVWKGTHVSRGAGKAIIVATGLATEIGKISAKIQSIDTDIPLKKNLESLSRIIIYGVVTTIAILFVVGWGVGHPVKEMLLVAVSLLVSVIPEGLPVVMTLVLALGVRRMAERNALVKRLQAVEALAHTNVLAVDKTGTLTRNEMVIQEVFIDGAVYTVSGEGYMPKGDLYLDGSLADDVTPVQYAAYLSAISANAELFNQDGVYSITGDPTEAALLVLGEKMGHTKDVILEESPLLTELPFDHEKKYYVNVHQLAGEPGMIAVGAPDVLLARCVNVWHPEGNSPMSDALSAKLEKQITEMASRGLRVLLLAVRTDIADPNISYDDVSEMTFVALYGMKDGLRSEIKDSVATTHAAGMRVVMITGDHADTAAAIAREAGILQEGDMVMTGAELAKLSAAELADVLPKVRVFARVTPDTKLEIIQAYRTNGDTIAMTGDGVNDVPPLLAADLGVAMGTIGTEVTKEAADIILLDDNFATITNAVEEGRHIFNTIQRVLVYLFSTNLGELLVIVAAVSLLLPVPMTPAQIIWLNLVTDTFLVIALAFQKKEKGLLKRPFAKPSKYILDKADFIRLVLFGVIIAIGSLIVFLLFKQDLAVGRTMVLLTLGLFQIFRLWSIRSDTQSVFTQNPFKEPLLITMSLLAVGLEVLVIYAPFMQKIFETVPLSATQWGIGAGVAFSIVVVDEVRKVFARRRGK